MSFERLGQEVAEELGDGPDGGRRDAQRAALMAAAAKPSRSRGRWLGGLAMAGAAVAVVLALTLPGEPGSGADTPVELASGAWLAAPEDAPMMLQFDARAKVTLQARTRARVARNEADTVRLSLESGRVDAEVEPSPGRAWSIEAGPYAVTVIGTVFSVTWTPEEEKLVVEVERGSVRVTGERLAGEGVVVPEGDRFEVSRRDRTAMLSPTDEADPDAGAGAEPTPEVSPPPAADPEVESETPARSRKPAPPMPWVSLARDGKYDAALKAADEIGFDRLLRTGRANEVDLLATAARLSGQADRAEAALLTLRQRFPATARGKTAAFLLGRVAMEQQRKPGKAAKWFGTYVREQPRGTFVAQARGRLVEALDRAGDRNGAGKAAREYLEHHPDGEYAKLARSLSR